MELAALALIGWLAGRPNTATPLPPRGLLLLAASWIALPLFQLFPLPPSLWRHMPGRAMLAAAQDALGQGQVWWPLAISPARTIASLLSMSVPFAGLLAFSPLRDSSRHWLARALVALGVLSGLVGVVQVLTGDGWLYGRFDGGYASGLMANRNAFADFLLIALLAHICWPAGVQPAARGGARRGHGEWVVQLLIGLFLVFCVMLSGSRTGAALLVVPLAALALRKRSGAAALAVLGSGALALAALVSLSAMDSSATRFLARFSAQSDPRITALWPDSVYAAREVWPVGVGVGGFKPEFDSVERLSVVADREPNRAHQDYLELAVEAGLPGLGLLAVSAALLARRAARALRTVRDNPARKPELVFAIGTITIIAAHSLVDYPLRCMTLAMLTSWAVALLYRSPGAAAHEDGTARKRVVA